MASRSQKKMRVFEDGDVDIISRLPDDLINKILSFLDTKVAVQTSVLSKRWKLIWTTLPSLRFCGYGRSSPQFSKPIRHVLSKRNSQAQISELELCISKGLPGRLGAKFIKYAITHNVEYLNLELNYKHKPYKLSTLSSPSLKKLTLRVKLDELNGWNLPALTTLHLKGTVVLCKHAPFKFPGMGKLPESCITCLPALRTLCLDDWDFSKSSFCFSLPHLTTLRLSGCRGLPKKAWNFPALVTLELDDVILWYDLSDILSALVNLQNLTLYLTGSSLRGHHYISFPQLLNLNIRTHCYGTLEDYRFVILAPKLCNFTAVGIFLIKFEVAGQLETVNLKLKGWFEYLRGIYRKTYYLKFIEMLSGLGDAKKLNFDLDSIEALSMISDFLANMPSPFCNLKYVKLPQGYKESDMSSVLRSYLLSGSPGANIVTTFPQRMIPQTRPFGSSNQGGQRF